MLDDDLDKDLVDSISDNDTQIIYTDSVSSFYNPLIPNVEFSSEVTHITGDLTIGSGDDQVNVGEVLKSISERLCIIQPNFAAMEQYPALKNAYDQYKMVEKLLLQNNKKD